MPDGVMYTLHMHPEWLASGSIQCKVLNNERHCPCHEALPESDFVQEA